MPVLTHPHTRSNFPTRSPAFRLCQDPPCTTPPYSALNPPFCSLSSFPASSSSECFLICALPRARACGALELSSSSPSLDRRLAELPEAEPCNPPPAQLFFFCEHGRLKARRAHRGALSSHLPLHGSQHWQGLGLRQKELCEKADCSASLGPPHRPNLPESWRHAACT